MIGRTVGHYRILERLGGGGMGVVYKAEDLTLDRTVALKFLPPELTRDEDAKKRFLIEAKAAAKLDHPNICNVYDVAESDDGQTFIAMAYYEGESLAKRIERGAIPVDEAAKIAVEVARGLGVAHKAGIIHRDIKPANVMLTAKGDVKIVDFGVAKLAGVTMTHGGGSPGTLAYMAPEQIRGEPVTPATDLWALGAVFYEMLTGSRPFRGDYEQAVAYTILNEAPVPLDPMLPQRSPAIDAVVARALTKAPKLRYQTAEELIEGLGAITGSGAVTTAGQTAYVRQIAAAAVAVILVAAAVWLWQPWQRRGIQGAPAPADSGTAPSATGVSAVEPKQVVVAVFENRSGDKTLDDVGRIASDWITDELSRVGVMVVPASYATQAALAAKTTPAEPDGSRPQDPGIALAERTGSGLLVSGEIYLVGSSLRIQAKVTDTVAKKLLATIEPGEAPRERPADAILPIRNRIRDLLASRLVGPDELAEWHRYETRPPRYEAYAEMALADAAGDEEKYLTHVKKAAELDPDYVAPYAALAGYHFNAHEYEEGEQNLALAKARREQLSPLGRLELDWLTARLAQNTGEMVRVSRERVRLTPGDARARLQLAQALIVDDRPREVVAILTAPDPELQKLITNPHDAHTAVFGFLHLTQALGILGEHERQLAEARRARAIFPDVGNFFAMEAEALAALGRLDELEKLVAECQSRPLRMAQSHFVTGRAVWQLRAHGHREESIEMAGRTVERAKEWARGATETSVTFDDFIAEYTRLAEDWDEAERLWKKLEKSNEAVKGAPFNADTVEIKGTLGVIAAARGDVARARQLESELERVRAPYVFGADNYERARIAAMLGAKEKAVEQLRRAVGEGYGLWFQMPRLYRFSLEPAFESLRGYEPFEEMLRAKG